jgi:hypothetical protein
MSRGRDYKQFECYTGKRFIILIFVNIKKKIIKIHVKFPLLRNTWTKEATKISQHIAILVYHANNCVLVA